MKRWVSFAAVAFAVTACQDASGPAARLLPAASRAAFIAAANPILGSYIVVMKDAVANVDGAVDQIGQNYGTTASYRYKSAIKGFAGKLSPAAVEALRNDPRIAYIEQNQTMSINTTQSGATWGIDRIDQLTLPLSGTYDYGADGTGVTVYIIDTGINFAHNEYNGRAFKGIDEVTSGGTAADCNGHGSHVSGTVGGTTYGVAKKVTLVAVRVLDCSGSGSTAGVIAGIDWVTAQKSANKSIPSAANMSLGGGLSTTLNQAVENSVAAGVVYAIAAGNSSANACLFSPASAPSAITVGATDINDGFASFSNRGSCVDINAPGVNITSAWMGTNTATNTISGTSMATPHVAGTIALYLQVNPTATAAQVDAALKANASTTKVVPSGTTNKFIYSGFITATPITSITVTPSSASVQRGGTQQFTATGKDASGKDVTITPTWSVGGGGTISSSGLFTATTSGGPFTVTATSGGVSGTAWVTVTTPPPGVLTTITVTPNPGSVTVGGQQQFTATGKDANGTVVSVTPTWSVSTNGGSISASGLLTAGTLAGTYTVTASSGSVTGTATVTVNAGALASITVAPNPATVAARATQKFTAVGKDAYSNTVSFTPAWSVTGGGTINSSGTFTAGTVAGTWTVKATNGVGGAIAGTGTVNVTAAVACTNGNCQN